MFSGLHVYSVAFHVLRLSEFRPSSSLSSEMPLMPSLLLRKLDWIRKTGSRPPVHGSEIPFSAWVEAAHRQPSSNPSEGDRRAPKHSSAIPVSSRHETRNTVSMLNQVMRPEVSGQGNQGSGMGHQLLMRPHR